MSSSNAIDDLVARFVADILDILERACAERRAEALGIVQSMLADLQPHTGVHGRAQPSRSRAAAPTRRAPSNAVHARMAHGDAPAAVPAGAGSGKTNTHTAPGVAPTERGVRPGRRREAARTGPAPSPRSKPTTAARQPADRTPAPAAPVAAAGGAPLGEMPAASPPSAATPEAQDGSVREALVFEAVRSLGRTTSSEIALRTGLPNGTVYVLLRSLVAAGRVARTDSMRGVEYSLVSSGSIQPFKRTRAAAPDAAPEAASHDGEGRGAAAPVVGREADAEGGELPFGAPAGELPGVVAPALT
jgi:hypothetical protein